MDSQGIHGRYNFFSEKVLFIEVHFRRDHIMLYKEQFSCRSQQTHNLNRAYMKTSYYIQNGLFTLDLDLVYSGPFL